MDMCKAAKEKETTRKPRAIICCVQVPCDEVLHLEAPALIAQFPGVELRMQKLDMSAESFGVNAADFHKASALIETAARAMVRPEEIGQTNIVLGLACTSMSFTLGADAVDALLQNGCPGCLTTDMARGQLGAIRALDLRSVALLTPYVEELSVANATMLSAAASVVNRHTLNLTHDKFITAITPAEIAAHALEVDCADAQGLVVGCSALRGCGPGFIDDLEERSGKPVVTSTQAFLWSMLRTAGVLDNAHGYGKLFRTAHVHAPRGTPQG